MTGESKAGAELTKSQREILLHTTGLGERAESLRNYFALYPESDGFADCEAMVKAGVMRRRNPDPAIFGDLVYFHATGDGMALAESLSPHRAATKKGA